MLSILSVCHIFPSPHFFIATNHLVTEVLSFTQKRYGYVFTGLVSPHDFFIFFSGCFFYRPNNVCLKHPAKKRKNLPGASLSARLKCRGHCHVQQRSKRRGAGGTCSIPGVSFIELFWFWKLVGLGFYGAPKRKQGLDLKKWYILPIG